MKKFIVLMLAILPLTVPAQAAEKTRAGNASAAFSVTITGRIPAYRPSCRLRITEQAIYELCEDLLDEPRYWAEITFINLSKKAQE